MGEPCQYCGCHANGLKRYLIGVAIAVTTAILIQSASLIWWAGVVNTRLQYCEKHLDVLTLQVREVETKHASRL